MEFDKSVVLEVTVQRYDQIEPVALAQAAPAFGAEKDDSGNWWTRDSGPLYADIISEVTPEMRQVNGEILSWRADVRVGVTLR